MRSFASTRPEELGRLGMPAPRTGMAAALWDKYELAPPRLLSHRAADKRFSSLPRAARFRLALEEGGGLFSLFGEFLAGRADLLPSPHLRQLRNLKPDRAPSAHQYLPSKLKSRIFDIRPLRAAPCSDLLLGCYQNRPITVEVFDPAIVSLKDSSWDDFQRGILQLQGTVESAITRQRVLERFHEWLLLQADIERKRAMLRNLENSPGGSILRFPRLVGELQSETCLVYEGILGATVDEELKTAANSREKRLQAVIEGFLEQSLLLSAVGADARLDNFVALPDGRLALRTIPSLAPVPPEWSYELLQYTASTVARNSPRALHMLARMSSSEDAYAGEQRLLRELSGLQPELKVNVVTPESVSALENYWRALAATRLNPPLFLELFHRQASYLGQHNSEVASGSDLIAESLWPVLGRILRFRLSELLSADRGQEWLISSGLLLLGTARQLGLSLEQVRDNDLALVVDQQEYSPRDRRLNRRTVYLVRSALALAVFLLAGDIALTSVQPTFRLLAGLVAVAAAIILSAFVARIE